MITLITGAPGAGKTAALVKLLSELAKGRPVFVDGVPDLKVEHQPLTRPREWMTEVPDGAAVVIDEVQRVWRPAGAGAKVPEDISALETHRHRGLDFFIVTQHPKLVHANVRQLVGRHVHLRDIGLLGRWWYEWPEAVDPATWRSAPVKKRYRLPRAHLALYRSATEHIKPVRSLPPVVFILAGAVVGLAVLGWFTYRAISSRINPQSVPAVGQAASAPVGASLLTGQRVGAAAGAAAFPAWPVYAAQPVRVREPYEGRGLVLEGGMRIGRDERVLFGLHVGGQRVATLTLADLVAAGYTFTRSSTCAGVLTWRHLERPVTCGPRAAPEAAPQAPAGAVQPEPSPA